MIFGQIREDLCESASKFFVGVGETGILKLPRSLCKDCRVRPYCTIDRAVGHSTGVLLSIVPAYCLARSNNSCSDRGKFRLCHSQVNSLALLSLVPGSSRAV